MLCSNPWEVCPFPNGDGGLDRELGKKVDGRREAIGGEEGGETVVDV